MSYKIGQFTRGRLALDEYKTDIDFQYSIVSNKKYIENQKKDNGLNYGTPVLQPTTDLISNKSYYLKFTILKRNGFDLNWNFTIKAYADNGVSQSLKTISYAGSQNNTQMTFEFIFTPKISVSNINFEIQRGEEDITLNSIDGYTGKYAQVIIEEFYLITNILEYSNIGLPNVINKLEIKSMPGLLIAVNGEEIRVGRRNIYELNYDKIEITSLGFVLKPSSRYLDGYDYFTMNYQYKEGIE